MKEYLQGTNSFLFYFLLIPLLAAALTQPGGDAAQPELQARLKKSAEFFKRCEYREAAISFQRGYEEALHAGQKAMAARFLSNLGAARFALHQYRNALQAFESARLLAEAAGDWSTAAALQVNIASVYSQMGALDLAVESSERALDRLPRVSSAAHRARLLLQLASLRARQDRLREALQLFRRGIAEADRSGDADAYSLGWSLWGEELLRRQDLGGAERALLEAFRIRKLNRLPALDTSYRDLGRLRLAQGDLRSAAALLDEAVERSQRPTGLLPTWDLYYARGEVRVAQGRFREALADLRIAVRLIRIWRRSSPPDDATRVGVDGMLEQVYGALVEVAGRLFFETGNPALAREAFEAAEENRAASLLATRSEGNAWTRLVPPDYWEALARLQRTEVALVRSGTPEDAKEAARLRAELARMEGAVRSGSFLMTPNIAQKTQQALGSDEALLAFHLGQSGSYLWGVTRERLTMYRLPSRSTIAGKVRKFEHSVRSGNASSAEQGEALYRELFDRISPELQHKSRWIVALEHELFDLPFAALVTGTKQKMPVYLAQSHSLQAIPGACNLLAGRPARVKNTATGPFLAFGDAVYNAADPRWQTKQGLTDGGAPIPARSGSSDREETRDGLQLARLVGSGREIQSCARFWTSQNAQSIVLEGRNASKEALRAAIEKKPSILHLATHVVMAGKPRQGLMILSLANDGHNEVLDPREIAGWRLDGALVVLSGCGSGAAEVLPGSGLMGLTRAWLAAGAGAVIASRWSVPDDSGTFFLTLYKHLLKNPTAGVTSAFQISIQDMINSRSWRSNPRFWAGYFLLANGEA